MRQRIYMRKFEWKEGGYSLAGPPINVEDRGCRIRVGRARIPADRAAIALGRRDTGLRLYSAMGKERIDRKVQRSTNNAAAHYAESLFASGLALALAGQSAKGYDAVAASGQWFPIKSRRPTCPRSTANAVRSSSRILGEAYRFLRSAEKRSIAPQTVRRRKSAVLSLDGV